MPQDRYWNFKADDKTRDINRWLTGILQPGLYFGFDFSPTANMNLNLVHTSTGFKDVDHLAAESVFKSLILTRQGVVVKEDSTIVINGVGNGDATHPRIDIVVLTHTIPEIGGGSQALYSIIPGVPGAVPVAPALANANTQIKIGELRIPAGITALNQGGITWTRAVKPGFAGSTSSFTPGRALVSDLAGLPTQSAVLTAELGTLTGINTGVSIQSQINGKQDTITGAITTVLTSNLTVNRVAVSNGAGKLISSAILDTELNQLAGIGATPIVTLLAGKQDTITGAITTVLTSNLTVNRAVVSNAAGKIIASGVLDTEINTLAGSVGPVLSSHSTGPKLSYVVLPIVDWNMDLSLAINVNLPPGITSAMVRPPLQAIIRGDVGGTYENFTFVSDGYRPDVAFSNQGLYCTPIMPFNQINIARESAGSIFDGVDFDATGGFIRGWVTVFYQL